MRRRPSGTYFQPTDDVRFSLLLDGPHTVQGPGAPTAIFSPSARLVGELYGRWCVLGLVVVNIALYGGWWYLKGYPGADVRAVARG